MLDSSLEIRDTEVKALLSELYSRYKNLTPAMRSIAGTMHDAVEENFAQEGRPKWAGLRPTTIAQRTKQGNWPGKILQRRGRLAASIGQSAGADYAKVTTADVRATTLHYGAKKGQFGKTKHGVPIPWGDIVARPFMRLTPKDLSDIGDDLRGFLFKGILRS